jgi:hypothetical protein
MSRYKIRVKTAQVEFIPIENFKNKYPKIDVKIELIKNNLVSINDVATEEQFEKFCNDFGISSGNYGKILITTSSMPYSRYVSINKVVYGHVLRSNVASRYFGVNDKYIKLVPIKYLSDNLKSVLGYPTGSNRKPSFFLPYTGDNEELKKIYDSAKGNFPGLTHLQWYELLQKPKLIQEWVAAGNNPDEFKNPPANAYFSQSIFDEPALNGKLLTLGATKEDISSMSIEDKVNTLQSQINRQLEEYFTFGYVLADTRNEKIKYVGNNPESLTEEVRIYGATVGQWSEIISKKYERYGDITSKFETEAFKNSSIENKAKVISQMYDSGFVPSKTKPKFAYTGNDPKTIEKLKEKGLYGRLIDIDDIKATDYITRENFAQRLSREKWTQLFTKYIDAVLSNAPNVSELREQLQKIWNEALTYSSSKSQMDKILDDTLKPLNDMLKEQGITFLDEQNVYAQYKAGETFKNLQLRFDYLVRKNGRIILAIENQGDQHYIPLLKYKNKDPEISLQMWLAEKLRDKVKLDFCHDHTIPLLYISGYLTTVEYRTIAENLAKNINYYVNLIPEEQQIEQPGKNSTNRYIVPESENLDAELKKYADRLIISHFSEFKQSIYQDIEPSRIEEMVHDKKILLSNLLAIFASNFKVNGYNNLDHVKSINESTDLSQYYRYIDAACARFGYADNQLGRMIEQISFKDRVAKNKYKLPDLSKVQPKPIEQETKPVQEMSLKRHKKKKYKIRRLF